MKVVHSNTTITADGDIATTDRSIKKLMPEAAPVSGVPIATQDNFKVPVEMANILVEIDEIEQQYLKTIHARFCIPRALEINLAADISRYYPDKAQDPNYYEYWYRFGTPQQFFLMSRRLSIKDGNPIFDIKYNVKLERGDENDQKVTK